MTAMLVNLPQEYHISSITRKWKPLKCLSEEFCCQFNAWHGRGGWSKAEQTITCGIIVGTVP